MIPFELDDHYPHTWFIDIDGTIIRHKGNDLISKDEFLSRDEVLPGVKEFWENIPKDDVIVLVTARPEDYRDQTLALLTAHDLRYDQAIFNLPRGQRILVNDARPTGLKTAIAWNVIRDQGFLEDYFNLLI